MKILVAHFRPDIVSGAEITIADFALKAHRQFQFLMLVPGEGILAHYLREKGLSVWTKKIENWRRLYPGLHTIQSLLFAQELKSMGVNLVLSNTFAAASRVGTAARKAGLPHVMYLREYISDQPIHRKMLAGASKIFTVSRDLAAHAGSLVEPEKVVVSYDPIDPQPILEKQSRHRAGGDRRLPFALQHPVVGLVGRITPYKQQDLFIRAVPEILAAVPESRFVVVGAAQEKEQDYEAYVKNLAGELGVREQVAFMGYRKDAIEITTEFSVACLTSAREPLARVIMDAQILGVPVVASATGGSPEAVEHEVSGLLFECSGQNDHEKFAIQVIRLLRDNALQRKLAAGAKEQVFRMFAGVQQVHLLEERLAEIGVKNGLDGRTA